MDNPLIRAFGLVAGYYRDPTAMRAAEPDAFDARVAQGVSARRQYEMTGESEAIPAVALEGDAAMKTEDTVDYYTRRAAVPNYCNSFSVMSREHFLPFDVQAAAPRTRSPVMMVHSDNALAPPWARKFHDALEGPKTLKWIDSHGQTDFYDRPDLVDRATDLVAHFLHERL